MPGQEGGNPPRQQVAGGPGDGPRAQAARGPSPVEGGDTPASQCALSAHGMPEQEGGLPQSQNGAGPQPEGEGGPPPEQPRTPFVRGLNQEMGGHPQDLLNTPPPQRKTKRRGAGDVFEMADGGGAPPPLGGRGTPDEQARAIVARIILDTPGGGPHSGQTPALAQQAQS